MGLITAIIVAVAIALIIATTTKNRPTEFLEEPAMEKSRAKGKLVLGKRDYGSSDVTTVAQQETVRE
jgi:hypothetical protein